MKIEKATWNTSADSVRLAMPLTKIDEEKRQVSGFASLDNADTHDDIVLADASARAFQRFRGNIREMHQPIAVGRMGVCIVQRGVNLAVARDADKTFKEQVCRPAQRILEKKLGRIFQEKTDLFRFKLNELSLTDEDTQSKIDERYLRMQTIVPNEVRARWGKSGIEGGDKVVDLKADAGAEAAAQGNRTRDADRSANATDSAGEGRNAKGDGRKQE